MQMRGKSSSSTSNRVGRWVKFGNFYCSRKFLHFDQDCWFRIITRIILYGGRVFSVFEWQVLPIALSLPSRSYFTLCAKKANEGPDGWFYGGSRTMDWSNKFINWGLWALYPLYPYCWYSLLSRTVVFYTPQVWLEFPSSQDPWVPIRTQYNGRIARDLWAKHVFIHPHIFSQDPFVSHSGGRSGVR